MDALGYYLRAAQVWLIPALAIVFTILMFHYNGAGFFRWIAVAFWAVSAYGAWVSGVDHNLLLYRVMAIVCVGLGIILAVIPTMDKHIDEELTGRERQIQERIERLNIRRRRINALRDVDGRHSRKEGSVWD